MMINRVPGGEAPDHRPVTSIELCTGDCVVTDVYFKGASRNDGSIEEGVEVYHRADVLLTLQIYLVFIREDRRGGRDNTDVLC